MTTPADESLGRDETGLWPGPGSRRKAENMRTTQTHIETHPDPTKDLDKLEVFARNTRHLKRARERAAEATIPHWRKWWQAEVRAMEILVAYLERKWF